MNKSNQSIIEKLIIRRWNRVDKVSSIKFLLIACSIVFLGFIMSSDFLWINTPPRLIKVLCLCIVFYGLLQIVAAIKNCIDAFVPIRKVDLKFNYTKSYLLSMLYGIGSWVFFLIGWEEYTLNGESLFWSAMLLGVLMGNVILVLVYHFFKKVFWESYSRFLLICALIFGTGFLVVGIAHNYNIDTASNELLCGNFVVTGKKFYRSGKYKRTDHYDVTLFIDDKPFEYDLVQDVELWKQLSNGDSVEVCFIQGGLGYEVVEFVDEYNPGWSYRSDKKYLNKNK